MRSQKYYYPWPFQVLIEFVPGSLEAGYIRARSSQDSINLDLQRGRIADFTVSKGWELARWYEIPEEYEDTEQHSFFARIVSDANSQFQVALCSASRYWMRNVVCAVCRDLWNSRTGRKEGS